MQALTETIKKKIKEQKGLISFHDFMHLALYAPNNGYYTGDKIKFGKHGDFTTAPEMTPLFAKTICSELTPLIKIKEFTNILEFGAGSGRLALDLLLSLEASHALPEYYFIIEVSGHLKAKQIETFKTHAPHLLKRVKHLDTLPKTPINAIVIANEVLDAMPVHRFRIHEDQLQESFVTFNDGQFAEVFSKPSSALETTLNPLLPLPEGYISEINLYIKPWLKALSQSIHKGLVLLFDYGFSTDEYYHPDRAHGTLMCHHQHKANSNPFAHIGEQDITAHVDFGYVRFCVESLKMQLLGYTNLAGFVMSNGILHLSEANDEASRFKDNQAIKQFTMPQEMGEIFKAMAIGIAFEAPLKGFMLRDLSRML